MARHVHDYDNNDLARVSEDSQWYLIDKSGNQVGERYTYIEEWGEGYYKIEKGSKKNIMRPDGSIVLDEWFSQVYKVTNKLFFISKTIPKSKTNPKTRYIYGVAHVCGDIIYPMIFDRVQWMKDNWAIYALIGTKPYILTPLGGIYDPQRSHLPKKMNINYPDLIEKFANWTMPGLQFYYRDTDAPIKADDIYHVGDIVRAGFFIDVTTKLLRPTAKTRYIIASAHTARIHEIEDLCRQNPNVKKWNLTVLHPNSYFKVMDVYKVEGVTQVFLLHIPPTAAIFIGRSEMVMKFINEATGSEHTLVGMARKSLDEKMTMDVHPRSLDREWIERTAHPVGLDDDYCPLPLAAIEDPDDATIANLSKMVHKLAHDEDIDIDFEVDDNFPWTGIEGRICDGCIYSRGIVGKGEGCGRLFQKSFRERYVRGVCEYRKTDLFVPSEAEKRKKREDAKAKDTAEKQTDIFALRLLREFIDEILDGDIDKLVTFDLSTIVENRKYHERLAWQSPILQSVMVLAFGDAYPELNVDSTAHLKFRIDQINTYQRLLGSNIMDQYFKRMDKFNPTPEQFQRALRVAHLSECIGNYWVMPNKFGIDYKDKYKGYFDQVLNAIYGCMVDAPKKDRVMQGKLYSSRKLMPDYHGEDGFHKFIVNMMLDDFVDDEKKPKKVFMGVWSMMKELDAKTYFDAVDEYCSFVESFILKRGERIVHKLKYILTDN